MLHPYRLARANTIPETALVISLVMITLFGVIEYAIAGFNQIGSDGAAFVGDHSTVAQYAGNPTITQGNVYGQLVGKSSFSHSSGYNASVPKSGTFEMDIASTQTIPGLAPMPAIPGSLMLFPSTVAARSRIIEPAQTTLGATPQGQCTSFAENITYKGTTILSRKVRLLSALPALNGATSTLYSTVSDAKGNTALTLAGGSLTTDTEFQALGTVSAEMTNASNALQQLGTVFTALGTLGAPAAQAVSVQISPLLLSASGGTYGATSGGTITVTTPLTSTQFATQVGVATNAISGIQNSSLVGSLLNTVFAGVVNPLLYGGTIKQSIGGLVSGTVITNGLLTGGPNGGILTDMNNAQNALYTLDSALPSC